MTLPSSSVTVNPKSIISPADPVANLETASEPLIEIPMVLLPITMLLLLVFMYTSPSKDPVFRITSPLYFISVSSYDKYFVVALPIPKNLLLYQ